jgi:hypothetical protein
MKDWKTLAIVLLAGVVLDLDVSLHKLESSHREDMRLLHQEINKVGTEALKTRLDNSAFHMVQMNCGLVEPSFKQWDVCVVKYVNSLGNATEPAPCPTDDPLGLRIEQPCTPLPPKR